MSTAPGSVLRGGRYGKPRTPFKELVRIMMASDLELAERQRRAGVGPAVSRHG